MADSITSSCASKCSCMPLQLAGVDTTMSSAKARGSHHMNKTLGAEPTAMELVTPDSTCQDIENLYWNMYQLQRLPIRG